jgi:hypothetical protein
MLTSVFGFRYHLIQGQWPTIDVHCGILYTLLNHSDKFHTVTLANGQSYRIANDKDISPFALEVNLKIAHSLPMVAKNTNLEISFGGKYSKNVTNNNFAIGIILSL